jgi:hypothetical protein
VRLLLFHTYHNADNVLPDFRRRLKDLKDPAYTIEESERAVGMGRDNGKDRINAEINAKVSDKAGEVAQDAKMVDAA